MKVMALTAFGGVEHFAWQEHPLPEPAAGEVRIRIRAVSLNPVDYKMRRGGLPVDPPVVLGRDVAGDVDAVGEGVSAFTAGDPVFAVLFGPRSNGAYAQYVTTPAAFVARRPAGLSLEQAAALPVAGLTAHEAVVRKARVHTGEAVLVAGAAGGVGSLAVPLLRRAGAAPLLCTVGGDDSAAHLAEAHGLSDEALVRYRDRSTEDMTAEVRERTGGAGVAAAFDFVGGPMKRLAFAAVGFDGRVVSIVEEPADFGLDIWSPAGPMFARSISYHFVAASARARNGGPPDWTIYGEVLAELAGLVADGAVAAPHITDMGELDEPTIREAHTLLETGHVKGKLVLRVG